MVPKLEKQGSVVRVFSGHYEGFTSPGLAFAKEPALKIQAALNCPLSVNLSPAKVCDFSAVQLHELRQFLLLNLYMRDHITQHNRFIFREA